MHQEFMENNSRRHITFNSRTSKYVQITADHLQFAIKKLITQNLPHAGAFLKEECVPHTWSTLKYPSSLSNAEWPNKMRFQGGILHTQLRYLGSGVD